VFGKTPKFKISLVFPDTNLYTTSYKVWHLCLAAVHDLTFLNLGGFPPKRFSTLLEVFAPRKVENIIEEGGEYKASPPYSKPVSTLLLGGRW
jgi:hypothetical protein